jgi:HD-GYP domain-containing protein (c-di-GMP phosphodiesterase class II)
MRKLMMAVGAVAGLSLLAGCQENRNKVAEEQRDVAEAQANASEKVAEARQEAAQETAQAQKEAQEETASARQEANEETAGAQREAQEEVAGAQQNIDEERKDVAEAREEVAQNQAEEREDVAQAEQEVAEEREDLATGGSGMAAGAAMTMTGTLKNVTLGDNLEVTDSTGKAMKLKTDDQTKVMWNNKPAKLDSFDEGTQVRASYVKQGDDMLARDVTIVKPVMKK